MDRITVEISLEKNERIMKIIARLGGKKKELLDKIIERGLLFFEK